jgi:hypothetical protein
LRKHGWWEWCSPALIEGSRFWNPSQSILEISSAQEGGTKIRHEKEKGDICTQQEPTKTKRKKKRRPKAGICWCTIEEVFSAAQGTKNGIEESKGVAEDAWLPEAENMVLLDGPLEGAPAASLPPATIAPGVVDGPTSGDDECLRSAPKTAKVKWKRGVVRSKN